MPTESPLVAASIPTPAARSAAPAVEPAEPAAAAPSDLPQTTEQLLTRMERHTRAQMRKQFGSDDPEQIKAKLELVATMEAAETERKRAALTEMERLTGDLNTERARSGTLQAELARVQNESAVTALCAGLGIRNIPYALFEASQAKAPEGGRADFEAHFRGLLAKPDGRAALGADVPATVAPVGVSTIPGTPGGVIHVPPPAGGTVTPLADANAMSPQQFQAHLAALGI